MKWAHFLHIYQPYDQHPGILDKIVNESYRPLLKGLLRIPEAKVTLNINSVLTELLFLHGYRDVLEDIKILVSQNRMELTGSAKFHAFLPLLPDSEVERQIALNHDTNRKYFGDAFSPNGFFSPEMGYSPKVAGIAKKMGYKWMLADEVSVCDAQNFQYGKAIAEIEQLGMQAYFREKRPSNLIMGALVRSAESLALAMQDDMTSGRYIVTAMDGETFGHHRPGLEVSLFDILKFPDFENILISDLPAHFSEKISVTPRDSTWASSREDVLKGNPFSLWFDTQNDIHKKQWELAEVALEAVTQSAWNDKEYPQLLEETREWHTLMDQEKSGEESKRQWVKMRDALDKALNSDPWWWASAKPWWSIEMIEKGMYALRSVVLGVPGVSTELKDTAHRLYTDIVVIAHDWQRTGKVDEMAQKERIERKIPMSKRFAGEAHYQALLDALLEQEQKASKNREYEQAIKWRDGQYKLERDLDMYDVVHIMDLFRAEGNFLRFQELLKEYQEKYRAYAKGQPE